VWVGSAAGLALLVGAATAARPPWLPECVTATARYPLLTEQVPQSGVTWPLVLEGLGVPAPWRWAAYAAGALGAVLLAARAAWDRARPASDTVASGLLAAFFVAPYGQAYDLTTLLVPALVTAGQLRKGPAAVWVAALLAGPCLYLLLLAPVGVPFGSLFWLPLILMGAWVIREWWLARHRPGEGQQPCRGVSP
jgi:hypothetical protein